MEEIERNSGLYPLRKKNNTRKSNHIKPSNNFSYDKFNDIYDESTGKNKTILSKKNDTTIYLVKNKIDKKIYIDKSINVEKFPEKKNSIKKIIEVLQNPKIKNDKNILKLYCCHKSENKINLIYDYFPNGNLYNYINENGPFSEENSFVIFYQILITIELFHKKGFILRNISPKKILIGDKYQIYFYDFSEIVEINDEINKNFYTYEEDIIPLGYILQILLKGLDYDEENVFIEKYKKNYYDELINDLMNNEKIKSIQDIFQYQWIKLFLDDPNQIILSRFREFTKSKNKNKTNVEESFQNDIVFDSYNPIKTTNDTNSNKEYLDILHNNYDVDYQNDTIENVIYKRGGNNNINYNDYSQYSFRDKTNNNLNDSYNVSQDNKSENTFYNSNSQKDFYKAIKTKPKKKVVLHNPNKSFLGRFGDFMGGTYCQ